MRQAEVEERHHSTTYAKQCSKNSMNRARSQDKMQNKMKNLEKMLDMAGNQIKQTQEVRKQDSSAKKPPRPNMPERPSLEKNMHSFTLKGKNIQRMCDSRKITKHESATDWSIMSILTSAQKNKGKSKGYTDVLIRLLKHHTLRHAVLHTFISKICLKIKKSNLKWFLL